MLGYPHDIKGYKVLDLDSNSTHISRNIIFYENVYPFAQIDSSLSSNVDNFDFPHSGSVSESFHSSPSTYEPPNFTSNIIPSNSVITIMFLHQAILVANFGMISWAETSSLFSSMK